MVASTAVSSLEAVATTEPTEEVVEESITPSESERVRAAPPKPAEAETISDEPVVDEVDLVADVKVTESDHVEVEKERSPTPINEDEIKPVTNVKDKSEVPEVKEMLVEAKPEDRAVSNKEDVVEEAMASNKEDSVEETAEQIKEDVVEETATSNKEDIVAETAVSSKEDVVEETAASNKEDAVEETEAKSSSKQESSVAETKLEMTNEKQKIEISEKQTTVSSSVVTSQATHESSTSMASKVVNGRFTSKQKLELLGSSTESMDATTTPTGSSVKVRTCILWLLSQIPVVTCIG